MTNTDNRSATLRYLRQMAGEMQKLAQNAGAPSLALLFDMAADEARSQLGEGVSGRQNSAEAGRPRRSAYAGMPAAARRADKAAARGRSSAGRFV